MIHANPNNEPFYISAIERAVSFLSQPRVLLISALALSAFAMFKLSLEASLEQRAIYNHPELCGMNEEPTSVYAFIPAVIFVSYSGLVYLNEKTFSQRVRPPQAFLGSPLPPPLPPPSPPPSP